MASKINLAFFNAYLDLDKACKMRFEVSKGGVTTYINRLVELRFAPNRSEVLPKLINYRKLRNIIAHEADAFDDITEITKEDVKWINDFTKSVERKSDPVSKYERKAKRYAIWRKVRVVLIGLGALAVVIAGIIIFNMFK